MGILRRLGALRLPRPFYARAFAWLEATWAASFAAGALIIERIVVALPRFVPFVCPSIIDTSPRWRVAQPFGSFLFSKIAVGAPSLRSSQGWAR